MVKSNDKLSGTSPARYTSPAVEVMEIGAEEILCLSGGTEGLGDGTGGWFDGTENLGNGNTTGWF